MNEHNYAPFYVGQEVVAVDALPGSKFINGQDYIVAAIEYKINPVNGKGPFWYIGIIGHANGEAWFRPGIFASKQIVRFVKFEQIEMSVN